MSQMPVLYAPALRMKHGELQGLSALTAEVADATLPRMIVPPAADRDESVQPSLFEGAEVPDFARPLSTHWSGRDVFVEATHVIDEFGRDQIDKWLPKAFERARAAGVRPIPLVQIRDVLATGLGAFAASADETSGLRFGLVVSSGDVDNREILVRAIEAMDRMSLSAERCAVLVDFHDADLSAADLVAPVIGGALDDLRSLAPWRSVIFQGTNFPEKNPADHASSVLVPRNEWLAWKSAVAFEPSTAEHLLFGDYAADCAKLAFGDGGGAAIRHYRYTTPEAWYVRRGTKSGSHQAVMRQVCEEIIESGYFAGREFSTADDFIYRTAMGVAGPGNAATWRAVNTTHHITRVVRDVGLVRGRKFTQGVVQPVQVQPELI